MKRIAAFSFCVMILGTAYTSAIHTTSGNTVSTISNMTDSSHWVFTADRMLPQFGRNNTVTGGYNVTYDPKKLVVYLPYSGRAYAGAGFPGEGNPLGFTSVDFKETIKQGKKGRLIVTIQPSDYPEVQTLIFTFFDNGNATLDVNLTNRSGISFTGRVEPIQ